MDDRELKEKFEKEYGPLDLCPKCKAIRIKGRWIKPEIDICKTYEGYREMYGKHIKPILCRRCDEQNPGRPDLYGDMKRRRTDNEREI